MPSQKRPGDHANGPLPCCGPPQIKVPSALMYQQPDKTDFLLSSYDFDLPQALVAQRPDPERDSSRLLVFKKKSGVISHRRFNDLPALLAPGDVLVLNNSRVFPARLVGSKESGGRVELFLLHWPEFHSQPAADGTVLHGAFATCLLKASKRPRPGTSLVFGPEVRALVEQSSAQDGRARVWLEILTVRGQSVLDVLEKRGSMPLPHYIQRQDDALDRQRYQTVYADTVGSVAAPTAGLHFTATLLKQIADQGVAVTSVTLHVGYSTFAPVRSEDIRRHAMHQEFVTVPQETAIAVNRARRERKKTWAVGTTTARTLEYMTEAENVCAGTAFCDLFIYPGYRFKSVDHLVTNFHLPRSTLLFLVAAMAGRKNILDCYQEAINAGYRFFSYGDAMAVAE